MECEVIYGSDPVQDKTKGKFYEDYFAVEFPNGLNVDLTYEFDHWENVISNTSTFSINNEKYVQFEFNILASRNVSLVVKNSEAEKIKDLYSQREDKRRKEKESISSYIDDELLEIAENLINLAEEDIFTNSRVIIWCQQKYYNLYKNHPNDYYNVLLDKECYYVIYKPVDDCKGKEKKEAEKFNKGLKDKFIKLSDLIDNFAEIIVEQKKLRPDLYMGKVIAWKCIQRKVVTYYAKRWKEEFEAKLDSTFTELEEKMEGQKYDEIEKVYIYNVIINDEINIEQVEEVLIYYLLSRKYTDDMSLYEYLDYYYELIKSIKKDIKISDIKQKLQTKQKRKINTYTIDDVDLMTGNEFEEFIGLLFKKMGYSSRITKQSGDQGLDVIAIRNGIKIGIQAKCYSNTVGNSAVQEAVAGKSFYNCDKVVVVTNSYFTLSAIELAQVNNVILWNRDMLKEKLKELM